MNSNMPMDAYNKTDGVVLCNMIQPDMSHCTYDSDFWPGCRQTAFI